MKICSFGTTRLDIRLFHEEFDVLRENNELNVSDLLVKVGGSVYYTSVLLAYYGLGPDYYTLHDSGALSVFVRNEIARTPLHIVDSPDDANTTAVSIILLNRSGEKKILSYDGSRSDSHILKQLSQRAGDYDFFYTSFYEVNEANIAEIETILGKVKESFLDLSPLIYRLPKEIVAAVLNKVTILSGTQGEFRKLFQIVGVKSIEELMRAYPIREAYEKRGKNGAALYKREERAECGEDADYTLYKKEKRAECGEDADCTLYKKKKRAESGVDTDCTLACYEAKAPGDGRSNDTTGCGDTFSAAVIAGKIQSRKGPDLLQFAVNSATLVAYEGFLPDKIIHAWKNGFSFSE